MNSVEIREYDLKTNRFHEFTLNQDTIRNSVVKSTWCGKRKIQLVASDGKKKFFKPSELISDLEGKSKETKSLLTSLLIRLYVNTKNNGDYGVRKNFFSCKSFPLRHLSGNDKTVVPGWVITLNDGRCVPLEMNKDVSFDRQIEKFRRNNLLFKSEQDPEVFQHLEAPQQSGSQPGSQSGSPFVWQQISHRFHIVKDQCKNFTKSELENLVEQDFSTLLNTIGAYQSGTTHKTDRITGTLRTYILNALIEKLKKAGTQDLSRYVIYFDGQTKEVPDSLKQEITSSHNPDHNLWVLRLLTTYDTGLYCGITENDWKAIQGLLK